MSASEIDVQTLAAARATGCRLFDVREPFEYEEVRIPGSTLIPFADVPEEILRDHPHRSIDGAAGRKRHDDLDRTRWVLLPECRQRSGEQRYGRDRRAGDPRSDE